MASNVEYDGSAVALGGGGGSFRKRPRELLERVARHGNWLPFETAEPGGLSRPWLAYETDAFETARFRDREADLAEQQSVMAWMASKGSQTEEFFKRSIGKYLHVPKVLWELRKVLGKRSMADREK